MIGYTRKRPRFSDKELKQRQKLEKEKKKKGFKGEKRNFSWFICAMSAFFVLGGTILPVVDIMFEDPLYSLIMVTIFGVSSTYIAGRIAVFFYISSLILGIILVAVSFTMFFVSKKIREKYGVLPS